MNHGPPDGLPRGVIGVVRRESDDEALLLGSAWLAAGVPGVEITMTVPDATGVIRRLAGSAPGRVGAGTVRTVAQAESCVAAGAAFLVSPHLDVGLVRWAVERRVPVVPGALTPSEIVAAHAAGASAVKIFPVDAVGGPDYVAALRGPLPDVPLVVSGGITAANAGRYLAAGVWSVCLGGALTDDDAVRRRDEAAATAYAAGVLRVVAPET